MESSTIQDADAVDADPETQFDGDYYYTKALNYLASSSSENVQSDGGSGSSSCECLHCGGPRSSRDKDDDHFTLGFRRGLTRDRDDDPHSSGSSSSISSSPRSDAGGHCPPHSGTATASSSSHSPASPKRPRERKCSIGGRFYKTGNSEFGKIEPRRKLSDGHVHWADEFHKELIRCHPRKSYSRHPSHLSSQVKPILKFSHEESEQC
ncbi:uncharacterized protein LOC143280636 [Babylonia areolata]|uniref:uncharacterized protein LOC143280636 n=1 Tax=Babylonia areolata TaxID=304850 RepID=UPI003FD5EAD6